MLHLPAAASCTAPRSGPTARCVLVAAPRLRGLKPPPSSGGWPPWLLPAVAAGIGNGQAPAEVGNIAAAGAVSVLVGSAAGLVRRIRVRQSPLCVVGVVVCAYSESGGGEGKLVKNRGLFVALLSGVGVWRVWRGDRGVVCVCRSRDTRREGIGG